MPSGLIRFRDELDGLLIDLVSLGLFLVATALQCFFRLIGMFVVVVMDWF